MPGSQDASMSGCQDAGLRDVKKLGPLHFPNYTCKSITWVRWGGGGGGGTRRVLSSFRIRR